MGESLYAILEINHGPNQISQEQLNMIEVVLDTNIYSSDPLRRTARFNALLRLAKSGKLRLHIPYLVQKEFPSQQTEHYEQLVSSPRSGIRLSNYDGKSHQI